jgi:osmotically inducible lipoprotein OsmB
MKGMMTLLAILLIVGTLAGCSWSRKDTGMVAGGVVGGVAGHAVTGGSTAGTVVGTVGGAYVGRQLAN